MPQTKIVFENGLRVVQALADAALDADADALAALSDLAREAAAALDETVPEYRLVAEASWTEIGALTGLTRQGARQRWCESRTRA